MILAREGSSQLLLVGCLLYTSFDDVALQITRQGCTPLLLMGLVFFFSGLGFKISLVPFHFWTCLLYTSRCV